MPIIDCGIPQDPSDPAYTEGLEADVFIKDRTGQPYLGVVSRGHMGEHEHGAGRGICWMAVLASAQSL